MAQRDEVTRAQDRARVCELLLKGYSKAEITMLINKDKADVKDHISVQQVRTDIEFMRNEYLKQGIEDYRVYRLQAIDELNLLKKTYWEAYELSRRNKLTIESESILDEEDYLSVLEEGMGLRPNESVFGRNARTREEVRLEGNPVFLQGVRDCRAALNKIYGIEAPEKLALTDPTGQHEAGSIAELMKQKMDELSERNDVEYTQAPKLLKEAPINDES